MPTTTLLKNKSKFTLESFKKILDQISIDYDDSFNVHFTVGDDLEMDSQEIVELLCELETEYNLSLKDGFIKRTDNVETIIEKMNEVLLESDEGSNHLSTPYEFTRIDTISIKTSISNMTEAIWDLGGWEEKLPHIKKIEILYDDNYNQEFYMTVQTDENKEAVKVRSIRRLINLHEIEFFQPQPPKYLLHHAGKWSFQSINNEQTEVILEHKWNVNKDTLVLLYPNLSYEQACEKIDYELFEHAQASLKLWKEVLEA